MNTYTGKQLADLVQREEPDMNLRTIRYYTQIGLLPPLELSGNKRVYTDRHLEYLRAILTLSKSGESLADIQEKLTGLPAEEVAKIGERLRFYQTEHIFRNETLVINEDVMLTVSPRISAALKSELVETVNRLLKGGQHPMTGAEITIEVRLAKSVLENEEGMNHLWVHLEPLGGVKQAVLELQLPAGVHWDGKVKGYPQDTSGRVIIEQPEMPNDLLLGIYTIQPIDCGLVSLSIDVSLIDHSGIEICNTVLVPLSIVDAESVDEETVEIDEEVIRRVKEQALTEPTSTHPDGSNSGMLDCSLPKLIRYDPHYRSELEEKYRVEGTGL